MSTSPPFCIRRAAPEDAARAGCNRVSLDTTRHLGRAIRFYEAHGFCAS
ncbi:MAG TPA: GNAT family N-acetyltransferase [Gemmataceae bacterium]|nr:GNAT family N-acetyltransferase [Gemmataceae bacterium]